MTQMDLFQTATSSQQDTPASPFHLPGSAEAQKMTDISGLTFSPLFKEKDPLGAFSRMFMGMSLWASTRCYLTWKGKATPQGRSLFQLAPSMPPTEGTGSGLWATPDASPRGSRAADLVKNNSTVKRRGSGQLRGIDLQTQAKMWPTPTAQDAKNNGGESQHKRNTKPLNPEVNGSLNPQWVEWLMGYPEGWTDLKD